MRRKLKHLHTILMKEIYTLFVNQKNGEYNENINTHNTGKYCYFGIDGM